MKHFIVYGILALSYACMGYAEAINQICNAVYQTPYNLLSYFQPILKLSHIPEQVCSTSNRLIRYPYSEPSLLLTKHINGFFSHNKKDLCSSQPVALSGQSSKSKFHNTRARIMRISAFARLRPMQLRGPTENGCSTSRLSW